MPMQVVVLPHDPLWKEAFLAESAVISDALGSNVTAVHHIGSTSVPGIVAKPIIDVLVEVEDIDRVDLRTAEMNRVGYEMMGEYGIPGRRYFRKENADGVRRHHVHVFAEGSAEAVRHLAFRDFLIAHPEWAQRYSELKLQLVKRHPDSIEDYMDGKDGLIQEIDRQAGVWRNSLRQG